MVVARERGNDKSVVSDAQNTADRITNPVRLWNEQTESVLTVYILVPGTASKTDSVFPTLRELLKFLTVTPRSATISSFWP